MANRKRVTARRSTTRKTARQAHKSARQTQAAEKYHAPGKRRPVGVAIEYTPELLENTRYRFEETDETSTSIAAELGVHRNTLRLLVLRMGWERCVPPRDLSAAAKLLVQAKLLKVAEPPQRDERTPPALRGAEEQASGSVQFAKESGQRMAAGDNVTPVPPAEQPLPPLEETIEQMHRAVRDELAAVQATRSALGREPQSPIDAERTARTLASLTDTLQKLRRMQCAMTQTGPHDDDDWPVDADEYRRDLARRIDAFVASRTGAGNGGASVA